MNMKPLRVYVDTSVFGGCFDDEFEKYSLKFFEKVKTGEVKAIISDIVLEELAQAPEKVLNVLSELPANNVDIVRNSEDATILAEEYINQKILTKKWFEDALHIAIATCVRADVIVSWNFKHIVRCDKIIQFNQVNRLNNYYPVAIYSPKEFDYGKEI